VWQVGEGSGARRREVLGWEEFGRGARELAASVVADGYRPDLLLAIARGGLAVAGAVSYALGIKNCCVLNVEYYTGVDERLEVPVVLPPSLDLVELGDARVLVVDDVADTGHTLQLVVEIVRPQVSELRTAVLYEKSRSVVQCDHVWRRTDDWIVFPWSALPPVEGARPDSTEATLRQP
jgi:hypoxanthine phosphoribosyltransferase